MTRTTRRSRRQPQTDATLLRQAEALAEECRQLRSENRRLKTEALVRAVEETVWDVPEAEMRFTLAGRSPDAGSVSREDGRKHWQGLKQVGWIQEE